jgi:hypothetical protein
MLPPITAAITATHTGNTGVTSDIIPGVISNITGVGVIITTIPGIGIMGVITVG